MYETIADLVEQDYDGSACSREDAERILKRWRHADASAKILIAKLGMDVAVTHYTIKWREAYEVDHPEDEDEE